jgi:hypothetical protein
MPRTKALPAIREIDPRAERAFVLRDQGWTHQRIATELGMSRPWVTKVLAADRDFTRHSRNVLPARTEGSTRAVAGIGVARGGRKTTDGSNTTVGPSRSLNTILPPPDYRSRWVSKGLEMDDWDRMSTPEMIRVLRHVSPDVSRAVWDYLRMLNPGYELTAYKVNQGSSGKDVPDPVAQEKLDAFRDELEDYYGSLKVQFGRAFMNALMRGSMLVELVTDQAGRVPVDLVVPDPVHVRFRKALDPRRGEIWEMGQWQNGQFISLDYPTIGYVAVDPEPDNPYGTAMFGSAIFPCLFLIGLLHDLRRVVAQQGYPRTAITIDIAAIRDTFPELDDEELDAKVDALEDAIAGYYATLQPDDAFIKTSDVGIETHGGAIATNVLASSAALIDVLERMAMRALKSNALLMGIAANIDAGEANRLWEIHAAGINSLQQDAENVFGARFQLAMEIQGVACRVELRFAKLRAAEEARDEQTFKTRLENAIVARDAGFWDQTQASMHAVHEAPALEEAPAPAAPPVAEDEEEDEQTDEEAQNEDGDQGDRAPWLWKNMTQEQRTEVRRRLADMGLTRAVDISPADSDAIDGAVETWEQVFAGEDYETLLDAKVIDTGANDES